MSKARKPARASLEGVAARWLASKQLARRSPASDAARRADLAAIAAIAAVMADTADQPEDPELPRFERQLSRLRPADLGGRDPVRRPGRLRERPRRLLAAPGPVHLAGILPLAGC